MRKWAWRSYAELLRIRELAKCQSWTQALRAVWFQVLCIFPWIHRVICFDHNHTQSPPQPSHDSLTGLFSKVQPNDYEGKEARSWAVKRCWWKEVIQLWNGDSELVCLVYSCLTVCTNGSSQCFEYLQWVTITWIFLSLFQVWKNCIHKGNPGQNHKSMQRYVSGHL